MDRYEKVAEDYLIHENLDIPIENRIVLLAEQLRAAFHPQPATLTPVMRKAIEAAMKEAVAEEWIHHYCPERGEDSYFAADKVKEIILRHIEAAVKAQDLDSMATVQIWNGDTPIGEPAEVKLADTLQPDLFLAHGGCPIIVEADPLYKPGDAWMLVKVTIGDVCGGVHGFATSVRMTKPMAI